MTAAADTILDAFSALVAERGFSAVSLRDVAAAAGIGLGDLYQQFPDKTALVSGFMARIDAAVLAGSPREVDPEETARDRLFEVMMRRYDALRPHRPALASIRQASARDPLLAIGLGPAIRRSMAAMLEAAGLASDGVAGAVRQSGLLAIHHAVARTFHRDDTLDLSKTMAALDSRLKTAEKWAQFVGRNRPATQAETADSPAE